MKIKNIAIIAHVDHGKTTLVDGMLKQTHTFRDNQAEMSQTTILDSNDQERERGITILAKTTTVQYKDTKVNIIDTPGHADFSGEVERVLNMADGALLIVDAAEGPLPQTRFVLEKSLEQGLEMMVLINKIDRSDAEISRVEHQIEDLFLQLAQKDEDLEFPILYGVAREGKVWKNIPDDLSAEKDLTDLFETIINTVPDPKVEIDKPFKMLVTNIDYDSYKGNYAIGKVTQGIVKPGDKVKIFEHQKMLHFATVKEVFTSRGLDRINVDQSTPGDIIALTGIDQLQIGHTIADPEIEEGFPTIKITDPTLTITINANTSPFTGKEGEFTTIRQLEERLNREKKTNLGMRIEPNPQGHGFNISGRGELHLSVLIEDMRREGYEMEVSKPQVILKTIDNVQSEPVEELTIDIDNSFAGVITEEMGKRKAEMLDSMVNSKGMARMVFKISSRNLLGFRSNILTKTKGNGIFSSRFLGYFPLMNTIDRVRDGVLIASDTGTTTAYALESVQNHGATFVGPGINVYEGMVIGQNSRTQDMEVNVCKIKKSTNMRAANADMMIQLAPPVEMSLEQSLNYIAEDELLEVTPLSLRIRKKYLTKEGRVKNSR